MKTKTTHFKTLLFLLAVLFVGAVLVALYVYNHTKEDENSTANQSLTASAETPYIDSDGQVIDLAQFSNQIRVVNSWATWSPLSKEELPNLDKLAENYVAEGVVFLAINRKENKDYAEAFLKTLPPLDNFKIIYDSADNFFSKVDGYAMPETIVFDKEGTVAVHYRGLVKTGELSEMLDSLIKQK